MNTCPHVQTCEKMKPKDEIINKSWNEKSSLGIFASMTLDCNIPSKVQMVWFSFETRSYFVSPAGPELRDRSASPVLGLQVWVNRPG